MGHGYTYVCKKCGTEYSANPGVGMMYPNIYLEKLEEIASGEHGEDWKELYNKTPYAAIDAETIVYVCGNCQFWEMGTDISLYAPNAPETIAKKQYGIKTVEEWGYVPYVMGRDLEADYHLIKEYHHLCRKCGKQMHKASSDELKTLSCPNCGEMNLFDRSIMWD